MANVTLDDEFDSLSTAWQPTYPWAFGGFGGGDMSTWYPNPLLLPADGNPISLNNGVLGLSNFPTPGDVSPDLVDNLPRVGGQLVTEGQFSQTYGYFEARMQMPAGAGMLGAFWLMPANGGWPPELDVAEVTGNSPTTLVNTVHGIDAPEPHWVDEPDMTQGFHTYAVDWEPDKITWYFDGQETFESSTPADMNQPMYMILSNGSGTPGSWAGPSDPSTSSQMQVDYVRVYDSNPYTTGGALTFQSGGDAGTDNAPSDSTSSDNISSDTAAASPNIIDVATGHSQLSAADGDVFVFSGSDHQTRISNFLPGTDKLDFEMTAQDFSGVSIDTNSRGWARINFDGNRISLPGVTPDQLSQGDFLFNTGQQ